MISCRTNFCLTCAFHVLHPHSAIFRHAHMSHDRHAMSHLPSRERDANHIMVSPYSNFKTARADTASHLKSKQRKSACILTSIQGV